MSSIASELKNWVTEPEAYRTQTRGGDSALTFEYANLPVPVHGQVGIGYTNNCGPTSGAMIAEYYKIYRGKPQLLGWQADHDELYKEMHTNSVPWPNGTLPWNAGPGFLTYAQKCGEWFSQTTWHMAYP